MRKVVIKPAREETLAEKFASRLREYEVRLYKLAGELMAIERDATAAGFTLEPMMLMLGRLKEAAGTTRRVMEHDATQFALDFPGPPQTPPDHDGAGN